MGATPGLRQAPAYIRPSALNGADIAIKGQFYPTTRDDSEMTADAFSLLGGGVSAPAL